MYVERQAKYVHFKLLYTCIYIELCLRIIRSTGPIAVARRRSVGLSVRQHL